jgi:CPA1 family monovalent cation:H+ antiporter
VEADVRLTHHEEQPGAVQSLGETVRRVRLGTVAARRRALVRLRDEGAISDEVLVELESELDYESLRLGAGAAREG